MSINLIAILLSFAMMLTGAGGAGQPAEAAKTLVIHNVSVTYNGETVELAPSLKLGAYTDGQKALFDLGLELNGETLMPVQLSVLESGITAVAPGAGAAATVTAKALEDAIQQNGISLEGMAADPAGNDELAKFISEEFMPAYFGMLGAVQDKDFQKRIQEKAEAIFAEKVDRGEGKSVTELVEGENMALTEYSYTLNGADVAELADAIYATDPVLTAYYDALFKLYAMLPEESGLNGMTSFADMLGQTGIDMTMDVVEKVSDDGEVNLSQCVLTMDMSGIIAAQAQAQGVAAEDVPEMPPIVMNIESVKIGENQDGSATCEYAMDEGTMSLTMNTSTAPDSDSMDMDMSFGMEGEALGSMSISYSATPDEEGTKWTALAFSADIPSQNAGFNLTVNCGDRADGTSTGSFALSGDAQGTAYGFSFDADLTADPIEDLTGGTEPIVIDDLSPEALEKLGEDANVSAALMKVAGAMTGDVAKLTTDESVQKLVALVNSMNSAEAADADDEDGAAEDGEYDYTYEIEDGDDVEVALDDEDEIEYVYEEPEDDGVLGYQEPVLTWLPEGWSVTGTEVDTAYDIVSYTLEKDAEAASVWFYEDVDVPQDNYTVAANGTVTQVKDTLVNVVQYDEGAYITFRHKNLIGNMTFAPDTIDMDTVGKIIAGIQ